MHLKSFGPYSKTCIVKVCAAWGRVSRGLTVLYTCCTYQIWLYLVIIYITITLAYPQCGQKLYQYLDFTILYDTSCCWNFGQYFLLNLMVILIQNWLLKGFGHIVVFLFLAVRETAYFDSPAMLHNVHQ